MGGTGVNPIPPLYYSGSGFVVQHSLKGKPCSTLFGSLSLSFFRSGHWSHDLLHSGYPATGPSGGISFSGPGHHSFRICHAHRQHAEIGSVPDADQSMRYFLIVLRSVFLQGGSTSLLWPQYWPMMLMGLATLTLAGVLFRHRLY